METGVVVQGDDGKKPMDEEANVDQMEIDSVRPSLNEVGNGMVEIKSYPRSIPENRVAAVKEAWPKVTSALKKYGISAALNLDELSMIVSTTRKTRDPKIILKARMVTLLLEIGVPVDKALRTLGAYPQMMMLEDRLNGLCSQFGIKKEKYAERRKLLTDSIIKELSQLTGCDLYVHDDAFIAATGLLEGIKLGKKIVTDCIVRGVRPSSQIRRIKRMNRVVDDLGALRV